MKKPKRPRRKTQKPKTQKVAGTAICPLCRGAAHVGDSEESLAALDPEAAVFYDRDVAETDLVRGLCGPRFRLNARGLHAHYGSPGDLYVVFFWEPAVKAWKLLIEAA